MLVAIRAWFNLGPKLHKNIYLPLNALQCLSHPYCMLLQFQLQEYHSLDTLLKDQTIHQEV